MKAGGCAAGHLRRLEELIGSPMPAGAASLPYFVLNGAAARPGSG